VEHKINKKLKPDLVESYDLQPGNGTMGYYHTTTTALKGGPLSEIPKILTEILTLI